MPTAVSRKNTTYLTKKLHTGILGRLGGGGGVISFLEIESDLVFRLMILKCSSNVQLVETSVYEQRLWGHLVHELLLFSLERRIFTVFICAVNGSGVPLGNFREFSLWDRRQRAGGHHSIRC